MGFLVVSGLNINLTKSELVNFGREDKQEGLACVGLQIIQIANKISRAAFGSKLQGFNDLEPVIDRFEHRVAGWKNVYYLKGEGSLLLEALLAVYHFCPFSLS